MKIKYALSGVAAVVLLGVGGAMAPAAVAATPSVPAAVDGGVPAGWFPGGAEVAPAGWFPGGAEAVPSGWFPGVAPAGWFPGGASDLLV
ncbi:MULTISPECIES: hypothetical protein [unclassified Streptomyces]|uniref:hypothetical protein n=1 Tax=unclassified Streptomyces TaxID=2593676 RepID=UPI002E27CFFC|nr:hypothetical protein [Streptomyces sp. NBC_01423]